MKPTRKKWWRPYLLVEVLVALSLVSLCAVPLLRPHIAGLRSEIAVAQRVELERLSEAALTVVKQHLYEHTSYEWKRRDAHAQILDLGIVSAHFLPNRAINYKCQAVIGITADAEGELVIQNTEHVERRLLTVLIQFVPEKQGAAQMEFGYRILAERMKFEVETVVTQ